MSSTTLSELSSVTISPTVSPDLLRTTTALLLSKAGAFLSSTLFTVLVSLGPLGGFSNRT